VREALVNARRHSGARRIDVALLRDDDEVCVAVSDDGRGFDPRTTGGGLGLSGMRERAHALGWELAVRSDAGKGTRVAVKARLHDLLDGPRGT
jgi:signal transduction histidine kinase